MYLISWLWQRVHGTFRIYRGASAKDVKIKLWQKCLQNCLPISQEHATAAKHVYDHSTSMWTEHATATCQAEKWRINSPWPITMHYTSVPVSSPMVIYSCPVIRPACKKQSICLPRCFFLIMSEIHPPENYSACSPQSTGLARAVSSTDG